MRNRLFLLLTLALFAFGSAPAFASTETTATFGDQNASGEYRLKATYNTATGRGTVAYASDTGILMPYENYSSPSANNTLTADESGVTITDMGGAAGPTAAGSCSKHTLPRAAPGMVFSFATGSKCTMTVDTVDTSDQILYSISGTGLDGGDSIKSTGQAGDSVTLFSTVANKWQIRSMKSVWTDNGSS